MATGLIDADTPLDALLSVYSYAKMHVGDPGAAGTANPATETDRASTTWGSASGGSASNSATITWTNVAATETWTHVTFWDAATSGNVGFSGVVTNGDVVAGADVEVEIGNAQVAFTLAS